MAVAAILKNIKTAISRQLSGRLPRSLARWRSSTLLTRPTIKNLKFQNFKIEKSKNLHISAAVRTI